MYPYFHGRDEPSSDATNAARQAYIVAGAMLDHFEHVRFQIATGAMAADRGSWDAYIVKTFKESPLLCAEFRRHKAYYGGGGHGTIGDWANQGCAA